jgi:hypothetical protein
MNEIHIFNDTHPAQDEPVVYLETEESVDPYSIAMWESIPGYEASYPVAPYEEFRPVIEKDAEGFHVKVKMIQCVKYTENDLVSMRADTPRLLFVPSSQVYIVVVWLNTYYIGFYDAFRLEHYQYLWVLDKKSQEFKPISEEQARELGLTIAHDADIVHDKPALEELQEGKANP